MTTDIWVSLAPQNVFGWYVDCCVNLSSFLNRRWSNTVAYTHYYKDIFLPSFIHQFVNHFPTFRVKKWTRERERERLRGRRRGISHHLVGFQLMMIVWHNQGQQKTHYKSFYGSDSILLHTNTKFLSLIFPSHSFSHPKSFCSHTKNHTQ